MEATEAVTAEIVPPPPPSSATRGQRPGSVRPKGAKRTLLTIEQKHAIFKYKQALSQITTIFPFVGLRWTRTFVRI